MAEAAARRTALPSAIALRLFAAAMVAAMSALVHGLGGRVELGQVIFWRSAVALLPIGLYAAWRGGFSALATRRPGLHVARGVLGALAMGCYFFALTRLSVANAQALSFLAPLFSLPLAALLLGERLGRRVLLAALLGFGGILAMLWHALSLPGGGALAGVLAGLGFAAVMGVLRVHIRAMTVTEPAVAIVFWFALATTLLGLATAPFGWSVPAARDMAALVGTGLVGGIGAIAMTESAARAPVALLAPFDYSALGWALLIDAAIFGTVPGANGGIGLAAITMAGLLVAQRRGRAQTPGGEG
ncbi:DMT family transporter [Acidimangrovimonas pyrenivorans]|uniref:DMT family transporter n=1 Tax=Acidimangrovimonas pyrenivorans TaxID=2030798 RepID=A0ABV7ACV2_9RHOB